MTEAADAWKDAWLRGQQELLKVWLRAAPGPIGGSAMPGAAWDGASNEVLRRFLGLYDQYLGLTRGLWEAIQAGEPLQPPSVEGLNFMRPGFDALDAPALGLGRGSQEAWQRIGRLGVRVAEAQARLAARWSEVLQRAVAAVTARVAERAAAGQPVESLKALYELWIECAESAYADAAHGAEYVELQAELANATSELRIEQRGLFERWARDYDLPTRAELDALHHRLKEIGGQLRALEARLGGPVAAAAAAPRRRRKRAP